jgi:lipopolysaccharide assembly LptE-like protein
MMILSSTRFRLVSSVAALLLVTTSCGYHTSAHGVRLPADMHTIYVPAFTNATTTYHIEQILTAAVVRELRSRTNYRIVSTNDGTADATLNGTVVTAAYYPLTYNSQTGGISSSVVVVAAKVSLVSSKGKVLWDNPNMTFREQYQIANNGPNFFEEESPALDRVASSFSQTLVSDMLEAY